MVAANLVCRRCRHPKGQTNFAATAWWRTNCCLALSWRLQVCCCNSRQSERGLPQKSRLSDGWMLAIGCQEVNEICHIIVLDVNMAPQVLQKYGNSWQLMQTWRCNRTHNTNDSQVVNVVDVSCLALWRVKDFRAVLKLCCGLRKSSLNTTDARWNLSHPIKERRWIPGPYMEQRFSMAAGMPVWCGKVTLHWRRQAGSKWM